MGLLDSLKGLLGGSEKDPKLDITKKALNDLKIGVEKMRENKTLNDATWKKLQNSFYEDCDELDMDETKKEEAWLTAKKEIEDDLLRDTPEHKSINAFIGNLENLPVLKDAIDNKKPQGLRARIDAAGKTLGIDSEGMNGVILGIMTLFGWNEKEGIGQWITNHLLAKPNPAPEGDTTTPPPAPKPATERALDPSATPETADPKKRKTYSDLFKGQNLTLDEKTVEADIKTLSESSIKEEDIEAKLKETMAAGGYLKELKDVIDKATDNKAFGFRLADLLFQGKTKEEKDKIKAAIQNADNTLPKTPEEIQKFLDELHKNSNVDEVIAKYNKPVAPAPPVAPPPATPAAPAPATPAAPPVAPPPATAAPAAPAGPAAPATTQ